MKRHAPKDPDLKEATLASLRRQHPEVCRHWFDQVEILGIEGGVLRIRMDDPIRLRYLQRSCAQAFTDAVQAATGRLLAVRFFSGIKPEEVEEPRRDSAPDIQEQGLLVPDYTFESFVVGPSNRVAHAAAIAVAARPARAYNPLFIHGGVGLGKTHLLQAICQRVLKEQPSTRLSYLSCDTFTGLFLECIRAGRMAEFRDRFRGTDLLVLDDIHFLSRREQTQEEFFHTFNALYQSGKQIILSSDAPPADIPDLEERLVSRFVSGLVARVDRPCYETRVSIVKTKADLLGVSAPDDVAAYIAARFDANIRELEGALAKVRIFSQAGELGIDLATAKDALEDIQRAPGHVSIQDIVDAVTRDFGVRTTDILSKRRHRSITLPRQVCMYLARQHTRHSLQEIGGHFGGRDHTTVLHAVRSVGAKADASTDFQQTLRRIQTALNTRTG